MISRQYGRLAAPDIATQLSRRSVLCLPIGAYEQHGPHLPLNTDTIIAERFTARLLERHGEEYDLWSLPALPYGLSREHAWSPGTISLTLGVLAGLLDAVIGEYVRATPARTILVVNGHGGNRGVLEAALYELHGAHGITVCAAHPSSLSTIRIDTPLPEIHAGMRETSVMLALAPEDVHLDRLPPEYTVNEARRAQLRQVVLDRGATWPWSSGDPTISTLGVMGSDPHTARAEIGESIIASAVDASRAVLDRLTRSDP